MLWFISEHAELGSCCGAPGGEGGFGNNVMLGHTSQSNVRVAAHCPSDIYVHIFMLTHNLHANHYVCAGWKRTHSSAADLTRKTGIMQGVCSNNTSYREQRRYIQGRYVLDWSEREMKSAACCSRVHRVSRNPHRLIRMCIFVRTFGFHFYGSTCIWGIFCVVQWSARHTHKYLVMGCNLPDRIRKANLYFNVKHTRAISEAG